MGQVLVSSSELAAKLSVSKGRISQYVSEGKLTGCWSGDGRARRFDLAKVCEALGKNLDLAQMMGNGSGTRRAISTLRDGLPSEDGEDEAPAVAPRAKSQRESGELRRDDDDRYNLARAARAEEDLRAARLRNGREEGLYVLASEVELQMARILGQEIAEMEAVLRDGARGIADRMGVDFRTARQILLDTWRSHRANRSTTLATEAGSTPATDAEQAEDI